MLQGGIIEDQEEKRGGEGRGGEEGFRFEPPCDVTQNQKPAKTEEGGLL